MVAVFGLLDLRLQQYQQAALPAESAQASATSTKAIQPNSTIIDTTDIMLCSRLSSNRRNYWELRLQIWRVAIVLGSTENPKTQICPLLRP